MINKITGYVRREKALNESIGAFIVEYEFVLSTIYSILSICIKKGGLKDEAYLIILTHDSTGYPLTQYMMASLKHQYNSEFSSSDKLLSKYLKAIESKLNDAHNLRNKIVHSAWIYGFDPSPIKDDIAISTRHFVKSEGLVPFRKEMRKEDFREYTKSLNKLSIELEILQEQVVNDKFIGLDNKITSVKLIDLSLDESKYSESEMD